MLTAMSRYSYIAHGEVECHHASEWVPEPRLIDGWNHEVVPKLGL